MYFYTHVFSRGRKVYTRGYRNGKQFNEITEYKPYMFMPKADGKYRTLDGRPVDRINFDSIDDAREFTKRYEDVSNFEVFGLTNYPYLYINNEFPGQIDYDPSLISVVALDIETPTDQGFPDPHTADVPISHITISKNGKKVVFGCEYYKPKSDDVTFVLCKDEISLLYKFLEYWNDPNWTPDIITGWNIDHFDIPYLYNRILKLCGEKAVKMLSPWRFIYDKEIIRGKSSARAGKDIKNKIDRIYDLVGIASLDYLELYKKFSFSNHESYRLDYIANVELGENKLDYSEFKNLYEFFKKDYERFTDYNIHDVVLIDKLEEKLGLIQLVLAMAYDAKINLTDTMTTVRAWDIIIHNYLLNKNIVIPTMKSNRMFDSLVGGYVKEPKIGMSKWVVSFDLNSLYPHLIMQYNISPETFLGRFDTFPNIDQMLAEPKTKYSKVGPDGKTPVAIAANGCYYRKDVRGFLPELMDKMYEDRKKYKKLMIQAKKDYERTHDKKYERLISRYHNMQLAKKIQLNSAYGALGNQYFRWFSFNNAEAITTSGQLSIRWIEMKINEFMNKMLKTDNEDYVIAIDTDSVYVTLEKLVKCLKPMSELEIVDTIDKFCETKIEEFIDKSYEELAEKMSAYEQKMQMKRETIANKGIWRGKKMYILNAWNVEGVQYDEPKLKLQGIEAVRSSTPGACREAIKRSLSIIMNKSEDELHKYIADFYKKFMTLTFEEVAFPRGVNGLLKYSDASQIYKSGTPIHTKGALIFNNMLRVHKLKNIQPINEGDKIKFAYLKLPNPVCDTVIAAPEDLPAEFELDPYIDRDMQFSKSFLEPIRSITDIIGWEVEKRSTLEDFFN